MRQRECGQSCLQTSWVLVQQHACCMHAAQFGSGPTGLEVAQRWKACKFKGCFLQSSTRTSEKDCRFAQHWKVAGCWPDREVHGPTALLLGVPAGKTAPQQCQQTSRTVPRRLQQLSVQATTSFRGRISRPGFVILSYLAAHRARAWRVRAGSGGIRCAWRPRHSEHIAWSGLCLALLRNILPQ